MDSLKLEMYLLALSKLESGEEDFVCLALESAEEEVVGGVATDISIRQIFPEFFALWDGTYFSFSAPGYHGKSDNNDKPWWETGHPGRIRTLRLAIEHVR